MKKINLPAAMICGMILSAGCGPAEQTNTTADDTLALDKDSTQQIADLSKEMITLPLYELSDLDDNLFLIDIPDTALAFKDKTLDIGLTKAGDMKIKITARFNILIEKYPGEEQSIVAFKKELSKQGLQKFKYISEEADAILYQWEANGRIRRALYAIVVTGNGSSFKVQSIQDARSANFTEDDLKLMLTSARSIRVNAVRS